MLSWQYVTCLSFFNFFFNQINTLWMLLAFAEAVTEPQSASSEWSSSTRETISGCFSGYWLQWGVIFLWVGEGQISHLWHHRTAMYFPALSKICLLRSTWMCPCWAAYPAGLFAIQTCTANGHPCLKAFKVQILWRVTICFTNGKMSQEN